MCLAARSKRRYFAQHRLRRRPILLVRPNIAIPDDAVAVHDERGDTSDVSRRVQDIIRDDCLRAVVAQHRECESLLGDRLLRLSDGVDADGDEVRAQVLELRIGCLQLSELLATVWSPLTSIEHHRHGCAGVVSKCDGFTFPVR